MAQRNEGINASTVARKKACKKKMEPIEKTNENRNKQVRIQYPSSIVADHSPVRHGD
jgi:hypothetical protein